jgi:hypothetical protein
MKLSGTGSSERLLRQIFLKYCHNQSIAFQPTCGLFTRTSAVHSPATTLEQLQAADSVHTPPVVSFEKNPIQHAKFFLRRFRILTSTLKVHEVM